MYQNIAQFYELFGWGSFSHELLKKIRPLLIKWKIKSHLDLACGTGIFVAGMAKMGIETAGIDASKEMVRTARKNYPALKFSVADMTDFTTMTPVDLITCNYDSINHLQKFSNWKIVFKNVYDALSGEGKFLFDINTPHTIKTASFTKCISTDNYTLINSVRHQGAELVFDLTWFIKSKGDKFTRHQEIVKEVSFPFEQIEKTLKKIGFRKVSIINNQFDSKNNTSLTRKNRLYILAEK